MGGVRCVCVGGVRCVCGRYLWGVCVLHTFYCIVTSYNESNSVPNNSLSVDQIPHNQSYIHTG